MNRMTRGTVLLAAVIAGISCKGDPTDELRGGVDHLVATPSTVFILEDPAETRTILVEAVDEQGNRLASKFNLTNVGAGISVVEDESFNPVFDENGNPAKPSTWPRIQYQVSATANEANSSFTVSAGGKNITIPVRILPDSATTVTVSSATPALGTPLTVTAGSGFKFTPGSVVTVPGATVVKLSLAADSSSIQVLVGPNANGPMTVTNQVLAYAPAIGGFVGTSGAVSLSTTVVNNLPSTFTPGTAAAFGSQDTITVTAGAGFKFLPAAGVSFGPTAVFIISRGVDSSTIRFIPLPGSASGPAAVTGVILSSLPQVPLNLPTSTSLTIPAATGNATALATAPLLTIPAAGVTRLHVDAGLFVTAAQCGNVGVHCRFYRIELAAPRTFTVTLRWGNTADVGGYFIDAAGNDQIGDFACDSFGAGAAGQPESCSQTLPAGTWYLALADFTAAAQNTVTVQMSILGE